MGYRSRESLCSYSMERRAESSKVTKFGCDTVWCFLEEEDATEMQGQSRGTGPIMYLLLERWEKRKKTETGSHGSVAETAMGAD